MRNTYFFTSLLFLVFSTPLMAQSEPLELDIDLVQFCQDQEEIDKKAAEAKACEVVGVTLPSELDQMNLLVPLLGETPEATKKKTCKSIMEVAALNPEPLEVKMEDDEGNKWKIRFHMGFSRTNYRATDVKISSTPVSTVLKGFKFDERTSAEHLNPSKWKDQENKDPFGEPTWTYTISIENDKNAFYLTAFHPKMLGALYEIKQPGANGTQTTTYLPAAHHLSDGTPIAFSSIPVGQAALEIQNTHQREDFQIGYGRKFTIFESKKAGKLTYIPRVDVGVSMGSARTIYIKELVWSEQVDKFGVQGVNASLGNRLEYKRGKVGAFVETKYTASQMKHGFMDGTATYRQDYSNLTFGVSVDVFTFNKKKKNQKEKKK